MHSCGRGTSECPLVTVACSRMYAYIYMYILYELCIYSCATGPSELHASIHDETDGCCIRMHAYVCGLCLNIACVHALARHLCIQTTYTHRLYIHVYKLFAYDNVHIRAHAGTYIHINIHTHVHDNARITNLGYTYMHTCILMHTCMHTHTYSCG